ncbi:MAG: hypothetical protein JSU70_05040 [Phycisphaerales bacterium]|nr:MAG: hypothetical protein JSU70_05040 [Phycisphaerales bacterium]
MSCRRRNLPLGEANPKELGDLEVPLYECTGKTYSIVEFVDKHKHLLNECEEALADENRGWLAQMSIPEDLRTCMTRSVEFASTKAHVLTAKRSGGRSAYCVDRKLKLKGCRPVLDGADYPIEILHFGDERIRYERIPFGTMKAESVVREILAYCFLKSNDLAVHSIPICVYEYSLGGDSFGCCLVSETKGEVRIEEFIEYPNCTVEDIVNAHASGHQVMAGCAIGSELSLRDIDIWWYVEQKSRFLSMMHFKGGFRGILNSNIGNDVVVNGENDEHQLYLCDFDTFRIVPIPDKPDMSFLRGFVLQCMVEVAKGSLSILEYVDFGADCTYLQIADALGEVYFKKSSLWHSYKRQFYIRAEQRRWDLDSVNEAFRVMGKTEAFASILCSCVLNSHYVSTLSAKRSTFYPHN